MGERLRTVGTHTGSSSFANHNVVGLARASDGEIIRQYRYSPYGKLTDAEGLTLDTNGDCTFGPLTSDIDLLGTFHTFQGLLYDPFAGDQEHAGLGTNHARNRLYRPPLARFLQQDPNGQALAIANALAMNGQTRAVFASLSASTQYADGLNLYQFVGSNPNAWNDPSGMVAGSYRDDFQQEVGSGFDYFAEHEGLDEESRGHRIASLSALNEGARWASLGLKTASDIALSLLPGYGIYEAYQSVQIIRSGRGGLMDYLSAGTSALVGLGTAVKALRTLGHASKWVYKSRVARRVKVKPFRRSADQFGRKADKHMREFGLDARNPADKRLFESMVDDIANNYDMALPGQFAGQGLGGGHGAVLFRIKGNHVVITKPDGEFVSILRDGISNRNVQKALRGP